MFTFVSDLLEVSPLFEAVAVAAAFAQLGLQCAQQVPQSIKCLSMKSMWSEPSTITLLFCDSSLTNVLKSLFARARNDPSYSRSFTHSALQLTLRIPTYVFDVPAKASIPLLLLRRSRTHGALLVSATSGSIPVAWVFFHTHGIMRDSNIVLNCLRSNCESFDPAIEYQRTCWTLGNTPRDDWKSVYDIVRVCMNHDCIHVWRRRRDRYVCDRLACRISVSSWILGHELMCKAAASILIHVIEYTTSLMDIVCSQVVSALSVS
jgi:hypothetical protein